MADLPPGHDADRDTGAPRWVKVFAIITIVAVLLFAVLHLAGGGFRGHPVP